MSKNNYFFYGNEPYLIEQAVADTLLENSEHYGELFSEILDSDTSLEELLLALDSLPLGFFKRTLVLKNPKFLFQKLSKEDEKKLLSYLDFPNEEVIFILAVDNIDKSNAIVKKIAEKTEAKQLNKLSSEHLRSFLATEAKKRGKKLDGLGQSYLIEKAKELPLAILVDEIEKASLYTKEQTITRDDLIAIGIPTLNETVFTLLDGIAEGRLDKAYRAWHDLAFLGEAPQKVLYQIIDMVKRLLIVQSLIQEGKSQREIELTLKKHPYVIKKAIAQASRLSESTLSDALCYLLSQDISFKNTTGLDTKGMMEDIIVTLIMLLSRKSL